MLPGKARGVPRPIRLRIRLAIKAEASPHAGPRKTAHNTLTICCTGAHLAPSTGKDKVEPTTATAVNKAATASFLVFMVYLSGFPGARGTIIV